MPCNAVLKQTASLAVNPALLLSNPALLLHLATQLQTLLGPRVALCSPSNWGATYSLDLAQLPLEQFDFPADGALFFADHAAIALYPDGRIELRDGYDLDTRPPQPAALLAQISQLFNTAAGLLLQQAIAAQLATLGTVADAHHTAAGALTLTLTL